MQSDTGKIFFFFLIKIYCIEARLENCIENTLYLNQNKARFY